MYASVLEPDEQVSYHLRPHRYAWIQIARDRATLDGNLLREGDGVAVSKIEELEFSTDVGAEILLFDLA
ncbi:MAG: hypothetical protein JOZ78_13905 [Chroococcidiopsidaceae cyanobacterium CP_BM_ER_R8_30]|nr:hypothetical protein [Chroococcidiopsidaceae cyanobacterium CP_BM_ER_R8_30]